MRTRRVAVAVFVDQDKNIYLQIRGEHSKSGEKYGFFGGGIEEGETEEEAFIRELKEELNWVPDDYEYKTSIRYEDDKWDVTLYAFVVDLQNPDNLKALHEMDRNLIRKLFLNER